MSILEVFLISLLFTFVLIYWIWILSVRLNNFSIIDAAWSGGFFIQSLIYVSFSTAPSARKLLFFSIVAIWSLRLCYYLTKRIKKHHPQEDTRYLQLRQEYGEHFKRRFLYFFIMQAVSISFLTFPFIFVYKNESIQLSLFEWIGFILFLFFIVGESVADSQLDQFKNNPQNKGKVCDVGLWKYSRHPNYFFESCIWFSFYIFMLGTSGLWWAIYAPLSILLLLLKVTGVPPSEAQSLKTRGQMYIEYQNKTSMFFPWFPKK